jgi:hypothetical protein
MAFKLTAFKAYGRYIDEPITTRCHQVAVLDYERGATGDTDADFGDFTASSTFWAAATGDATYGTLAVAARAALQKIAAKAQALQSIACVGDDVPLVQGATASAANVYALQNSGTYPAIQIGVTHKSAEANPTKVRCVIEWVNKVEERAERYGV